jgi:hypothetical protein
MQLHFKHAILIHFDLFNKINNDNDDDNYYYGNIGMTKHPLDRPFNAETGINFTKSHGSRRSRKRKIGDAGVENI